MWGLSRLVVEQAAFQKRQPLEVSYSDRQYIFGVVNCDLFPVWFNRQINSSRNMTSLNLILFASYHLKYYVTSWLVEQEISLETYLRVTWNTERQPEYVKTISTLLCHVVLSRLSTHSVSYGRTENIRRFRTLSSLIILM